MPRTLVPNMASLASSAPLEPRAAQAKIRLNMVVPGYTPTHMTSGFGQSLLEANLEHNTPESIALTIAQVAASEQWDGIGCLVRSM